MKAPLRELPEGYKKRLLSIGLGIGVPLILLMWALYAARVAWGWDLWPSMSSRKEPESPGMYLFLATLMTVVVPVFFWRGFGRSAYLYQHGVEVVGRVTDIGIFRMHGMAPVTFEYEWLGNTYSRRVDMSSDKAKKYKSDPAINLVIDPNKPSIVKERDVVFGAWLVSGKKPS